MADLLVARLTGRDPGTGTGTGPGAPTTWAERVAATTWADCDTDMSTRTGSDTDAASTPQRPDGAADIPASAAASQAKGGIEIQLVMTDQTLFGVGPDADAPAHLAGYGSLPAPIARELIAEALERAGIADDLGVWARRVYAHPTTGALTQMESGRRDVPQALARFLRTRDRYCRTPWCGAPLRHLDHVVPVVAGGETTEANLQGLCEACNYAKQAPGWRARPGPEGAGTSVEITTPTGHTYRSEPPAPPGARRTA